MALPQDSHTYPSAPVHTGSLPNVLQQYADVAAAAQEFNVDPNLLWGVYGVETGYGKNIATSSAGAMGPFQFIPSTAKSYGYPLTNKPNEATFKLQARAAAKYLRDLGVTKNASQAQWEKGLRSYSGQGYGIDRVRNALKQSPQGGIGSEDIPGVKAVTDAASTVASTAGDVGSAIGKFFDLLTSLDFWLRIGEGIAGLVLIAMGLKTLTGATIPTPIGRV